MLFDLHAPTENRLGHAKQGCIRSTRTRCSVETLHRIAGTARSAKQRRPRISSAPRRKRGPLSHIRDAGCYRAKSLRSPASSLRPPRSREMHRHSPLHRFDALDDAALDSPALKSLSSPRRFFPSLTAFASMPRSATISNSGRPATGRQQRRCCGAVSSDPYAR